MNDVIDTVYSLQVFVYLTHIESSLSFLCTLFEIFMLEFWEALVPKFHERNQRLLTEACFFTFFLQHAIPNHFPEQFRGALWTSPLSTRINKFMCLHMCTEVEPSLSMLQFQLFFKEIKP